MQPGHNGGYNEHRDSHGRFAAGLRVPHPDAKEVFREGTVRILHPPARADGSYHAELWNGDQLVSETRLTRAHRSEMAALQATAVALANAPQPSPIVAPPAVVSWKAAMTKEEADVWAKDSAIPEELFHMVRARDAYRMPAILANGFKADHNGSHGTPRWGDGIYLAYGGVLGSKGLYQSWMEKGDAYTIRVNVKRPFKIEVGGDDRPDMKKWLPVAMRAAYEDRITAAYATERLQAGPRPSQNFRSNSRIPYQIFKEIVAENGYDALLIGGSGIHTGGKQLLVFDPKNVTITGKEPFVYERSYDEEDFLL
jgi:hypothetical protein